MSIKSDLQKIQNIKEDMHTELTNKEVGISNDTPFEEYPEKVKEIEAPASSVCCILKVEPTPSDATVTFTNLSNFQNQASVMQSNSIGYTVSKDGYVSVSDSELMDGNKSIQVVLPRTSPNIVKVRSDTGGILLLTDTGDLWATGRHQNSDNKSNKALKIASNVKDMWDSVYLTNDGELYGKGSTKYNMLKSAEGSTVWKKFASNIKDFDIDSGSSSAAYIDINNDLYLCGKNDYGQQGSRTTTDVTSYTKRASNVKKVATGWYSTQYIDMNNALYSCGNPRYLGINSPYTTPTITTFAKRRDNVINVVNGDTTLAIEDTNHNLYITGGLAVEEGQINFHYDWLFCCSNVKGYDLEYTLFYIDSSNDLYASATAQAPTGDGKDYRYIVKVREGVKQAKGCQWTSYCIDTDNKLYSCAFASGSTIHGNRYGQLGTGDYVAHKTWTYVTDNVTDISGNFGSESCVVLKENTPYACGYNPSGALGVGSTEQSIPTLTPILFDYQD